MSSAKSPTGRFGLLFGLKRRPSSNFQQQQTQQSTSGNVSPSYQQRFFGTGQDYDPFAAHTPPTPSTALASSPIHTEPRQKDTGLLWNFEASDASEPGLIRPDAASPEHIDPSNVPARRPSLGPSNWPSRPVMGSDGASYSDHGRSIGPASAGSEVIRAGNKRPYGTSATSVESLALAAAIAHANGMVLQPDPSAPTSVLGIKSPHADEYPSPPPSTHESPYNSGIPSSVHPIRIRERGSEDDDTVSADGVLLHLDTLVGSAGTSSLPTTPALIDSFPATPHAPHHLPMRGHPAHSQSPPLPAHFLDVLPIRNSSRREYNNTVLAPEVWSSSSMPPAQRDSSVLNQAWNVAERDEEDQDYNYPFPLHTSVPGPPPSAPLPPEPLPARMQSSALQKRMHELEVDLAFLERKMSPTSPLSTASLAISFNSSKSSSPRLTKKTSSQRGLNRESSGPSGSSAASSNLALSPSSGTVPPSTSPPSSESPATPSKRQRSLQLSLPTNKLRHSSSFGQRSTSEMSLPIPTKTKEKEKKPAKEKTVKEKDTTKPKDEKDRETTPKRRFFSKYSSIGSTIDRDAVAAFPRAGEGDDARSLRSMQSTGTGFPDEEWGAIAISSSLKTQESCIGLLPLSPTSQQSPADEVMAPRSVPQTPARNPVNPTEYTQQYILPPAEILRLERVGFVTPEHNPRRGRDGSISSAQSTSGPPPNALGDWRRRSTSTSRLDTDAVHPSGRQQRSGSLAGPPSGQIPSPSSPSRVHDYQLGSRSFAALPTSSELGRSSSTTSSVTSSQKPRMTRSFTSPSSTIAPFDSLPPPPRSRMRSLRGANEPGTSPSRPSTATSDGHSMVLSPPPRTTRRPSTASSVRSVTTQAQKHYSILRKPSFLDIADDDGRPSLEEASAAAAPGIVDDPVSYRSRDPSPQATIHSGAGAWGSSSSLSIPSTSRQPTPVQRTERIEDDSFLDMGKMSLETIRSEPSGEGDNSQQELLMQRQRQARLASLAHAALAPQYQPNAINHVGTAY